MLEPQQLTQIALIVASFAVAIAAFLYLMLVRVQRRLRAAFTKTKSKKPYELQFFLEQILKQKLILNLNTADRDINSQQDLTEVLTEIAKLTKSLFECQFVELCLIDDENEIYHSACSVGEPIRNTGKKKSFYQEIKPIIFAGKRFGIFRIVFNKENALTGEELELFDLLSLQTAIAILNSKYTNEMLKLRKQSEESLRAKTGFLANLSHEIRGPLGIMLNAVEIVLSGVCGEISETQDKTLKMVKKNGDHLLDLINDVLDYAKVEAGKITPEPVPILVSELIGDVGKLVNSQALKKKHKFYYEDEESDLAIRCDRRHIRQILINLLTNAIKYTPSGGEIRMWAEKVSGNKVKIFVKDNGVGIAEADKNKVFSAFERIDNDYSKKQVGTGLGMPLTVKLVHANKGNINFESEPNSGSTFWVAFDSVDANRPQRTSDAYVPEPVTGHGENILLLEPDREEAVVVEHYLSNLEYNVRVFEKIDFNELVLGDCDIVLIENTFLDELGPEFIQHLRDRLNKKKLPVVLISSRAFDFDIEHYLKMGVDICINKPFKLADLALKIQSLI